MSRPFSSETLTFQPSERNLVVDLDKFYHLLAIFLDGNQESKEANAPIQSKTLTLQPSERNLVVDLDNFYHLLAIFLDGNRESKEANALIQMALISGHSPTEARIAEAISKLHSGQGSFQFV